MRRSMSDATNEVTPIQDATADPEDQSPAKASSVFSVPGYAAAGIRPAVKYRSPMMPAVTSAILGLLMVLAGVYLAARFGFAAAGTQIETGRTSFNEVVLTAAGGALLLGAVALNGWSCWATLVPGLLLTGIGGWAFENPAGLHTAVRWTLPIFRDNQLSSWHLVGFTMTLGLVLLGASAGAAVGRRSS